MFFLFFLSKATLTGCEWYISCVSVCFREIFSFVAVLWELENYCDVYIDWKHHSSGWNISITVVLSFCCVGSVYLLMHWLIGSCIVCLFVCLFICVCCVPLSLSSYLSFLSIYLSICFFVCLYTNQSTYISIYLTSLIEVIFFSFFPLSLIFNFCHWVIVLLLYLILIILSVLLDSWYLYLT